VITLYCEMKLRIIGGNYKGRKLQPVQGKQIRPTADRVREAIFDILGDRVRKAMVLDLFAGTGALGIEALSRGADSAVFIDNDENAILMLRKSIQSCAVQNKIKIIKWNIIKNLNCIYTLKPQFDLVFMDPPYNEKKIKPALLNLQQSRSLIKGADIIIEHSVSEPISANRSIFKLIDQRRYGKTLVSFLNLMI